MKTTNDAVLNYTKRLAQNVKLLKHHQDFISDETTYVGMVSGHLCGKTTALCYKAIDLATRNKEYPGIIVEPNRATIVNFLIPTLHSILNNLEIPHFYNNELMCYELTFGSDNRRIYMVTGAEILSNVKVENALAKFSWFGVDEIDVYKKDVAESIWDFLSSIVTPHNKATQGFCVFTPYSEEPNFMYDFFVTNAGPDRKLITSSTRYNLK